VDQVVHYRFFVYNFIFRKAYNRVEWPFTFKMIHALRFGLAFITIVDTLFVDASTCLAIIIFSSKEVRVSRSI
jgi:hypothetical protein